MVKEFLLRNGVDFVERKVDTDREALIEFRDLNVGMGVPVTVIDGEAVRGYDQAKLMQLIKKGAQLNT